MQKARTGLSTVFAALLVNFSWYVKKYSV